MGSVLMLVMWVESALGFRVLVWPGAARGFEGQTQQCVDRLWDPEVGSLSQLQYPCVETVMEGSRS